MLLAELPYGAKKLQDFWNQSFVDYTRPVPRQKTTLSILISYMNEILQANLRAGFEVEYARATLCMVRLFIIFDLFKHVPDAFFDSHLDNQYTHHDMLQVSGFLRLNMLSLICRNVRDNRSDPIPRCTCKECSRFNWHIEDSSKLYFIELPDFLLQTFTPLFYDPYKDLIPKCGWNDDDAYFEVYDGKVQALFIWDCLPVPYTWLSRKGEPWIFTRTTATVKHYDEYGRGGILEWNLENDHYELEFSNIHSTNYNVDCYLCNFDPAGIQATNQARSDANYSRQEEKERCRGKTVGAMREAEKARRTACEGRF